YPTPATFGAEWMSGATAQTGPTPAQMVSITDEDGTAHTWVQGEIPSVVRTVTPGTVNNVEGNIILTNGMMVGDRRGGPDAPGNLVGGQPPKDVLGGQGLRLQIVNCATMRYFRLRLTYPDSLGAGVLIPIVRVGGEAGLLDNAIREGGDAGTIVTPPLEYERGELVLPPATRADVVVMIPTGLLPGTTLTMWTRDYKRIGNAGRQNWSQL